MLTKIKIHFRRLSNHLYNFSQNPRNACRSLPIRLTKRRRTAPAFTMTELLIVVTIIAIITIAGVSSFRENQITIRHKNTVNKIMSMIQKTRSSAINSKLYDYDPLTYPDPPDPVQALRDSQIVPAGFGVHFYRPHDEIIDTDILYYDTSSGDMFGDAFRGYGGEEYNANSREPARVVLFVDNRFEGNPGCYDNPNLEDYFDDDPDYDFRSPKEFFFPGDEDSYENLDSINPAPDAVSPEPRFCNPEEAPSYIDPILEEFILPEETSITFNGFYTLNLIYTPPFGDLVIHRDFQNSGFDPLPANSFQNMFESQYFYTDQNTARIDIQTGPFIDSIFINRLSGMPFLYE